MSLKRLASFGGSEAPIVAERRLLRYRANRSKEFRQVEAVGTSAWVFRLLSTSQLFNGESTCSLLFSVCLHLCEAFLKIYVCLRLPAQPLNRSLKLSLTFRFLSTTAVLLHAFKFLFEGLLDISVCLRRLAQDMWFYLFEQQNFSDFGNEGALIWHETNIPYAVWGPQSTRSLSLKYHLSEIRFLFGCIGLYRLLHYLYRGTRFIVTWSAYDCFSSCKEQTESLRHVFFCTLGYSPNPNDPEYRPIVAGRIYCKIMLSREVFILIYGYRGGFHRMKQEPLRNSRGLKEDVTIPEYDEKFPRALKKLKMILREDGPPEWISYWKPNVTINLVNDFTSESHKHDKMAAIPTMDRPSKFIVVMSVLEGNPCTSGVTMIVSRMHSLFDFRHSRMNTHVEVPWSGIISGNKKEYDDLAMKYLSYVLFFLPCALPYTLMYDRHKSWYSWILSSPTRLYMFGKFRLAFHMIALRFSGLSIF
ncbi:hypothetical protein H5410_018922 [Solanum commersonii]|uniref:Uncharacterized protein n=1 Tax=Solanum commersonii TaxID=4109 RepID=A0A9J6A436_SOLCO|nr:hypothetical protein H5410_018922 [Solanum commersonii]